MSRSLFSVSATTYAAGYDEGYTRQETQSRWPRIWRTGGPTSRSGGFPSEARGERRGGEQGVCSEQYASSRKRHSPAQTGLPFQAQFLMKISPALPFDVLSRTIYAPISWPSQCAVHLPAVSRPAHGPWKNVSLRSLSDLDCLWWPLSKRPVPLLSRRFR